MARMHWISVLMASAGLLCAAPAFAQVEGEMASPDASEEAVEHQEHVPSLFVSTAVDVGYQYLRPRGSVGYGHPWKNWVGIDANPLISGSSAGGYSGLRVSLPPVDLRVGGRYIYSFRRSFLPVQDSYDRRDIEFDGGDAARYMAWETELTLTPEIGPGYILSESAVTYMTNVPKDEYVYTEHVRIVAAPPWIIRQRLGYVFPIAGDHVRMGIVAEYVRDPDRKVDIWRGGLLFRVRLYDDLEARDNFIPVLISPDSLGIKGGDFAQLGIRWTWSEDL